MSYCYQEAHTFVLIKSLFPGGNLPLKNICVEYMDCGIFSPSRNNGQILLWISHALW